MRRPTPSPARRRALGRLAGAVLLASGPGLSSTFAEDPRIALLEAVRLDDADTVKRLLGQSVSPNLREKTHGPAIVMAARLESFKALAVLARAPDIDLEARDASGQTALMMVAIKGHEPSVELLLDRGAKIDNKPDWTALHYAASSGQDAVVRLLVRRGANMDARSANGTTPIMMAARNKNFGTMELLADLGADLTARNDGGRGVLEYLAAHQEADRIADMRERIARRKR